MMKLRRRMSWLAFAWLVCQLTVLAAPVLQAATAAIDDICTCPGGMGGTECPMHHSQQTTQTTPGGPALRNSCAPVDAALLSLAGGLGILTQPAVVDLDRTPTIITVFVSIPASRTELLDSPPPRA